MHAEAHPAEPDQFGQLATLYVEAELALADRNIAQVQALATGSLLGEMAALRDAALGLTSEQLLPPFATGKACLPTATTVRLFLLRDTFGPDEIAGLSDEDVLRFVVTTPVLSLEKSLAWLRDPKRADLKDRMTSDPVAYFRLLVSWVDIESDAAYFMWQGSRSDFPFALRGEDGQWRANFTYWLTHLPDNGAMLPQYGNYPLDSMSDAASFLKTVAVLAGEELAGSDITKLAEPPSAGVVQACPGHSQWPPCKLPEGCGG